MLAVGLGMLRSQDSAVLSRPQADRVLQIGFVPFGKVGTLGVQNGTSVIHGRMNPNYSSKALK